MFVERVGAEHEQVRPLALFEGAQILLLAQELCRALRRRGDDLRRRHPGLDHQLELHVLAKSLEPGQHAAVCAVADAHACVRQPLQVFLRGLQDAGISREVFVARERLVVRRRLQDFLLPGVEAARKERIVQELAGILEHEGRPLAVERGNDPGAVLLHQLNELVIHGSVAHAVAERIQPRG